MTEIDAPRVWELVTPSAALLLPPGVDYDDPAVIEVRRSGIHGSDVPDIVGADGAQGNARTVWHAKHDGLSVDEAGEPALWGKLHEPTVAAEWGRRHGLFDVDLLDVGTLVNVDQPWMRAQVDRLLYACPDGGDLAETHRRCALEVKCRSGFVASLWRDDVPDDVLAQVAWQRLVTGLDHIHIACLIDGNRLVEHRYDRDEQLETMLAVECGALWDRVVAGDPPEFDWDAASQALLRRMFPDRAGARELTADEYAELVGAWNAMLAAKRVWQRLDVEVKGKALEALGPHEALTFEGRNVFTHKAHDRKAYTVPAATIRSLRGPR